VRDKQIAEIRQRKSHLREDRLTACYAEITRVYGTESPVEHLAMVIEEQDRTPTDFRILSNSEARRLREFNDDSYHWDHFCRELGRSIAHGERQYIFEELQGIPPTGITINAASPVFDGILTATQVLVAQGYNPDVLCAPISLFVPFAQDSALAIDWNSSPTELLTVPGGPSLKIH